MPSHLLRAEGRTHRPSGIAARLERFARTRRGPPPGGSNHRQSFYGTASAPPRGASSLRNEPTCRSGTKTPEPGAAGRSTASRWPPCGTRRVQAAVSAGPVGVSRPTQHPLADQRQIVPILVRARRAENRIEVRSEKNQRVLQLGGIRGTVQQDAAEQPGRTHCASTGSRPGRGHQPQRRVRRASSATRLYRLPPTGITWRRRRGPPSIAPVPTVPVPACQHGGP